MLLGCFAEQLNLVLLCCRAAVLQRVPCASGISVERTVRFHTPSWSCLACYAPLQSRTMQALDQSYQCRSVAACGKEGDGDYLALGSKNGKVLVYEWGNWKPTNRSHLVATAAGATTAGVKSSCAT